MHNRMFAFLVVGAALVGVFALSGTTVRSQSASAQACPTLTDFAAFHACALEKIKTFDPPRTKDGKPNMNGTWTPSRTALFIEEITGDGQKCYAGGLPYPCNDLGGGGVKPVGSLIVDPPDRKIPYQPWAQELRTRAAETYVSPHSACFQQGPHRFAYSGGSNFLQTPDYFVIVQAGNAHMHRIIPMKAGPRLNRDDTLWMGDSRGHWEGNTLVVETTNIDDRVWFDHFGSFFSKDARMVERFAFVDANTIHYEETVTDPNVFTRAWTISLAFSRSTVKGPDAEIWPYDDEVDNCYIDLTLQLNSGLKFWPGVSVLRPDVRR